jgi:tetratricopeptide (TPR) repeat protein
VTEFPRSVLACAVAVCLSSGLADSALAQQVARLSGSVKDLTGRPIKGASIRANNPSASPNEFNVASDSRGNWGMIGLAAGPWEVTAGAPGFESATVSVRLSVLRTNPNVDFVLVGMPPRGALEGISSEALQGDLSHAEELMAAGNYDEALAIYRALLAKVPPLTTLNLAIGRALRMKKDYAGAAEAYGELLKADPENQKALLELGRTHQEGGDRAAAVAALEKLVALDSTTDEAREARTLLAELKKSS